MCKKQSEESRAVSMLCYASGALVMGLDLVLFA